jgi:hypothetical protein
MNPSQGRAISRIVESRWSFYGISKASDLSEPTHPCTPPEEGNSGRGRGTCASVRYRCTPPEEGNSGPVPSWEGCPAGAGWVASGEERLS